MLGVWRNNKQLKSQHTALPYVKIHKPLSTAPNPPKIILGVKQHKQKQFFNKVVVSTSTGRAQLEGKRWSYKKVVVYSSLLASTEEGEPRSTALLSAMGTVKSLTVTVGRAISASLPSIKQTREAWCTLQALTIVNDPTHSRNSTAGGTRASRPTQL